MTSKELREMAANKALGIVSARNALEEASDIIEDLEKKDVQRISLLQDLIDLKEEFGIADIFGDSRIAYRSCAYRIELLINKYGDAV